MNDNFFFLSRVLDGERVYASEAVPLIWDKQRLAKMLSETETTEIASRLLGEGIDCEIEGVNPAGHFELRVKWDIVKNKVEEIWYLLPVE